jgi:hypothetical protein
VERTRTIIWAFSFKKDAANTKIGIAVFSGGDELLANPFASLLNEDFMKDVCSASDPE